jgi:hypothetical protein
MQMDLMIKIFVAQLRLVNLVGKLSALKLAPGINVIQISRCVF